MEPETVLWCMCKIAAEISGVENAVTSSDARDMLMSATIDKDNPDVRIVNTPFEMALLFGKDCLMDATPYDNRFGEGMAIRAIAYARTLVLTVANAASNSSEIWEEISEKVVLS